MRVQDQLDRLLTVASYALEHDDWELLERVASQAKRLDPDSVDAAALLLAARSNAAIAPEAVAAPADPAEARDPSAIDVAERTIERASKYWPWARGPARITIGAAASVAIAGGAVVLQAVREEWEFIAFQAAATVMIMLSVVVLLARRGVLGRETVPLLLGAFAALSAVMLFIATSLVVIEYVGEQSFGDGFGTALAFGVAVIVSVVFAARRLTRRTKSADAPG